MEKSTQNDRNATPEEDPAVEETGTHGQDEATEDMAGEERESDEGEEFDPAMFAPPSDVPTLTRIFIPMLAESAWQNLGLIARPGATEVSMDLKQVKLAIDAIEALFTALKGEMEDGERRDVEGLLTNLRLNFVDKSAAGATSGEQSE